MKVHPGVMHFVEELTRKGKRGTRLEWSSPLTPHLSAGTEGFAKIQNFLQGKQGQ